MVTTEVMADLEGFGAVAAGAEEAVLAEGEGDLAAEDPAGHGRA